MKNEELIQRLLDGNLSPEEKQRIQRLISIDPGLKREYDELAAAVRAAETSGRLPAPADFTSSVMRRLTVQRRPERTGAWAFFFKSRVLQWNAAGALAAVLLITAAAMVNVQVWKDRSLPAAMDDGGASTVRIYFYAPDARTVALAGDFNKWAPDGSALTRQESGIWTIDIPLHPGVYQYMFVVDGHRWVPDPNAESYRDDGFGQKNSVLRVAL